MPERFEERVDHLLQEWNEPEYGVPTWDRARAQREVVKEMLGDCLPGRDHQLDMLGVCILCEQGLRG